MKIINKIKGLFKKTEPPILMTKPPEIKITTIKTEHYKARTQLPYKIFREENPELRIHEAKNLLMADIERIIRDRLVVRELPRDSYGEPYTFETDIFIGFGDEANEKRESTDSD